VLDTASRLLVVDCKDSGEMPRFETYVDEKDLARRCLRIQGLGIDTLICGAVTRHFSDLLKASGIKLVQGISGQPEAVLNAYLDGPLALSKYLMPGLSLVELDEGQAPLRSREASYQKTKNNGNP
jgi:predicted Fe-Mo cluster-binding NifX family protein